MLLVNKMPLASRLNLGVAAFALCAMLAPSAVNAQTTEQPADATPAADDTEADDANEIVVTGSRIARPDIEGIVPTAAISAQAIDQNAATNIQDTLNELPQVGIGTSRTNSNFLTGANGVATVNLRNLGSNRTLILINGRRVVSGLAG